MNSFTITYRETLPDALQVNRDRFEAEARWAMAVKLFELGRLSSGLAASLIPCDRVTFLLRLADYGVAAIDLDEDDLIADLDNA
jgi:predicted HTH domain antitoxin